MPVQIQPCHHLKANGVWCGSPALRGHRYCYFHHQWRETKPNRNATPAALELPLLEDANAIQVALERVMQAIVSDQLEPRKAGLLLYALQTAALNLKNANFEPYKLKEQAAADCAHSDEEREDDNSCAVCAEFAEEEGDHEEEGEKEEGKEELDNAEVENVPVGCHSERAQRAKNLCLPGEVRPAKLPPRAEHDKELSDDELIKAVRQLAGLT